MDRSATSDFTTSLPSPYPSQFGDSRSEVSPSSATHQYSTQPETRQSHYSTTAAPNSDYNYPASARSGSFQEHLQRQYHPSATIGGASMASNSSSLNLQDGADAHQDPQQDPQQVKSDSDVPIDPSITAQSPTQYSYPQASPYGSTGADMSHYGHPGVYAQGRPDWAGYAAHTPITPNHSVFGHHQTTPTSATQGRGNQVSVKRRVLNDSQHSPPPPPRRPKFWAPSWSLGYCSRQRPSATVASDKLLYRFLALYLSLVHNSTSDPAVATRRSNGCTSVVGTDARRHTAL